MIRSFRLILPTLLLAGAAEAQQSPDEARQAPQANAPASAPAVSAPEAQPRQAGPTVDRATAGVRVDRSTDSPTPANPLPRREPTQQNKAMMIVGGAALLAGAIIGKDAGTIVMIGGAGLGLWGLWKYLE